MKRIRKYCILFLFAIFLLGCNSREKSVEVIIDGDGRFPENIAGLWRSENNAWDIYIEPDGKVSWAVISLGEVKIEAGKTRIIPMKQGGQGIFEPGLWSVVYLQKQRELSVEIVLNNFRTELGEDVIRGNTRDIFSGQVSQDGTLWQTDRFSYSEYIVDTKEYQNYKLPVDPNENPKESLLFRKISETAN